LGVAEAAGEAVSWPEAVVATNTPLAETPAMNPARYSFCSGVKGWGSGAEGVVAGAAGTQGI